MRQPWHSPYIIRHLSFIICHLVFCAFPLIPTGLRPLAKGCAVRGATLDFTRASGQPQRGLRPPGHLPPSSFAIRHSSFVTSHMRSPIVPLRAIDRLVIANDEHA